MQKDCRLACVRPFGNATGFVLHSRYDCAMINLDHVKKVILDVCFQPVDLEAPNLEPDAVLRLGDDPDLFDPARNGPPQQGEPKIRLYDDVTVWPAQSVAHRGESIAFDTFIDEARVAHLGKLNALRYYPTWQQDGWVTTIESVYPMENHYHFLVDSLPRVWALHHPALRDTPITLYLTRPLSSEKRELLRVLLPSNVSLQKTHRFTRLHVNRYIHLPYLSKDRIGYNPDKTETSGGFIPQEYLDYFRGHMLQRAESAPGPSPKRIFVSRRGASMRRLINEKEVVDFLEERGFVTVRPEEYGLAEQARLFDSARVVVAQHGAALANLMYMRGGAVVEIFSSSDTPQYYEQCARTLGLRYEPVTLGRGWKNADAHLPVDRLAQALDAVSAERTGGIEGGVSREQPAESDEME